MPRRASPSRFGTAVRRDGAWWCRLTPTRALVVGAHPAPSIRERLSAADGVNLVDVTTNFAALTIVGALSRELFARFSAIDLRPQITPVGGLRPGSVARQPAIVICEVRGSLPVPVRLGDGRVRVVGGGRRRAPPRRPPDRRRLAGRARGPSAGRGGLTCLTSSASAGCGAASPSSRSSYDVVIIGGGSHGLATAHYLKDHGITNVAILEQRYIGSGASRPQHHDPALQLQDARGRALLRRQRQALRGAVAGSELQPAVLAMRSPDPGPRRPGDVRDGQPGRGQPAATGSTRG